MARTIIGRRPAPLSEYPADTRWIRGTDAGYINRATTMGVPTLLIDIIAIATAPRSTVRFILTAPLLLLFDLPNLHLLPFLFSLEINRNE